MTSRSSRRSFVVSAKYTQSRAAAGAAAASSPSMTLDQRAHLVRQIVELDPELTLRIGAEDFIQLADASGLRIDAEELVAEERL